MPAAQTPNTDTVPPMPHASSSGHAAYMTNEDLREMARDAASLRESAARIEAAARNMTAVANSSQVRLGRKEKMVAAGVAVGLVATGVGGTLAVQAIRRGRAARRAAAAMK